MNRVHNQIFLPFLLLIFFLGLSHQAQASGWSCKSFWTEEMEKAKQDKAYQSVLIAKAEALVAEQKKIFFEKHPGLYNAKVSKMYDGQNAQFMTLLNACPDAMHMTGPIENEIQKVLYQQFNYSKARRQASVEGCHVSSGKAMKMFNMGEGVINLCSDEFSSAEIGVNSDASGQPKNIRFCPKPWGVNSKEWDAKAEVERCQSIEPSPELLCLSDYGLCQKKPDEKCGWVHTERSKQCLEKMN